MFNYNVVVPRGGKSCKHQTDRVMHWAVCGYLTIPGRQDRRRTLFQYR